MRAVAKAKVAS